MNLTYLRVEIRYQQVTAAKYIQYVHIFIFIIDGVESVKVYVLYVKILYNELS